ncbi:sugar transferase [Pseudalkalibacillus hwajinpoensis]|uniref:sugar transferase n=1 Tax=Guptibacillus hwajinpoensis TaxID=208199 RepID=UPI00325B7D48
MQIDFDTLIFYEHKRFVSSRFFRGISCQSERITKIGKVIRKLSFDELPKLFNILKGEMSFIGPRPLLIKYLPYYTELEVKRHNVRPESHKYQEGINLIRMKG